MDNSKTPDVFIREVGDNERHSWAVIEAVSSLTDTDPLDLPPYSDRIDADGFNNLFRGTARPVIVFQYAGCDVEVEHDKVQVSYPAGE